MKQTKTSKKTTDKSSADEDYEMDDCDCSESDCNCEKHGSCDCEGGGCNCGSGHGMSDCCCEPIDSEQMMADAANEVRMKLFEEACEKEWKKTAGKEIEKQAKEAVRMAREEWDEKPAKKRRK